VFAFLVVGQQLHHCQPRFAERWLLEPVSFHRASAVCAGVESA
jgi:hypothetical protein